MKQRLPFLRNRSLYRRRTIKFDRLDPSLVETPFLDLSFRVERSPFQRRRSEKRPTSVFQKRARAEFPRRVVRSWARLMRPEKRNAYSFILSTFKRVALKRRVRFISSLTLRRVAIDAARLIHFPYFSRDVKRCFRSIPKIAQIRKTAPKFALQVNAHRSRSLLKQRVLRNFLALFNRYVPANLFHLQNHPRRDA